MRVLSRGLDDGDIGIVISHVCPSLLQQFHENVTGRFTLVVYICLVRQPHNQDATAIDGFASRVESIDYLVDHILRHRRVDFAREFNESGVLPVLARLPSEIERIDWDAMAAKPRP